MVGGRRDSGEVVLAVLRAVVGGCRKTHIQVRANMNPEMLDRYLRLMLKADLIMECVDSDGNNLYRITEDGLSLLRVGEKFYTLLRGKLKV